MSNKRPLMIGAGLVAGIGALLLLFSQQPQPSVRPTPPIVSTPSFGVTPSGTQVSQLLPTLTPTSQPTPVPTKPRPGYTPVPDNVVSPIVVDQSPAPGEEARPDGSIQIAFDRPMDRSAVESAFQVYPSTKGTFTWSNDQTVVFKPDQPLTRGGLVDVVLDQRAKDQQGAPLNQAYQFRFATAGYLEVAQVIPAPSTADAEPASNITVIFNRPVVPLTNLDAQKDFPQPVSLSANGKPIEGSGEWLNTSIYVFHPVQPLPGGTIINATVSANPNGKSFVDTDGNPLKADYKWQFAVNPPKVVYITPGNESGDVPIETPIIVQFNQPISLDSAKTHVTLTSADGKNVTLNFEVLSETLTITPTSRLDYDTIFIVKVSAGLQGRSGGNGMIDTYTSGFHTVPLPRLIGTTPKDGDRNADPYTPFQIQFNTIIDPDSVMAHVTFTPPLSPTQVYTYFDSYGHNFVISFGAQPSTDYEVQITPGIKDPYGNETKEALTVRFHTGDLPPSMHLHVPNTIGTYNAYDPAKLYVIHTNIHSANFKLYRLDAATLSTLPNLPYNYTPSDSQLIRSWSMPIESKLNAIDATLIDLVEGGGRLEPGLYYLIATSPDLPKDPNNPYAYGLQHVLVVSKINLTMKTSADQVLVWATDYKSGQPVANVALTFYSSTYQPIKSVTTDEQGVARTDYHLEAEVIVGALSTSPFAAIGPDWSSGISQYDFGMTGGYYYGNTAKYNSYIYTDRPIYRPGQAIDFKGILRVERDVKYKLPDVRSVHVTIGSPTGEMIFDKNLDVSELGTFFGNVKLADGAALGSYYMNVTFADQSFSQNFTVAAYRAPEFQVNVTPKDDQIVRGQATTASVDVSYFFGGGVAGRPVQWNVLAETYNFQPPFGGNYTYNDYDDPYICFDCWWFQSYAPPPQPILSGSGVTDKDGKLSIEIPGDLMMNGVPITGSVSLIVEATVTGSDNQVISGRNSIIRHSGDYYVGIQAREYVGEANKTSNIDLIAVDWNGNRLANKAITVDVIRRDYENRFIEDTVGGGYWSYQQKDVPITTLTATTNDRGEATVQFIPPSAGSYKATAKSIDGSGREIRASVFMWVTGREFVSWRRDNNDRISLIGDKSAYAPGETAHILIPSPFQGEHWALVTIERGTILSHQLLKITSNSQILDVPIAADFAPNIYVSVVLVKGQDETNKLSDYKVGLLPLEVKPVVQKLSIVLTPDRAKAQPGEEVTYQVQATSSDGQPLQAEFSLDLVDKAVLSLMPRTPDAIVEAFYGKRSLGVNTSSDLAVSVNKFVEQLKKVLDEEHQALAERQAAGGGPAIGNIFSDISANVMSAPMAAPMPTPAAAYGLVAKDASGLPANITVREQFADTAYWNPRITTDASGNASIKIKLPDNLTTWTFRGVGLTSDTKVGEATVDLISTKPLLVRPVTPRFFTVGDKAELAANISNNTDNALDVTAILSSTGLTLNSAASQVINIAAHSEAKVTWTVEAQDVRSVQLAFIAQSGDLIDASKPRLSTAPDGSLVVYRYTAPDIVGTAGQIKSAGGRTEIVSLPPRYDVTKGEVSIEIDPSLAAGMVNGLDYLEHYQYECTEQTVSRFLPNVLTYRALKDLGIDNKTLGDKLPRLVSEGLDRLYLGQHNDGGWGWWLGDNSSPHLTAYVVFGLIQARDAGFDVKADVIDRGEQYLIQNLKGAARDFSNWEANQQAWFLYVLSTDNKAPANSINDLFGERSKMSYYARAYLALAIGNQNKEDARLKTILSDLNNAAIVSATGVHWEEDGYDWWSMNTDTRSTAIILDAYAQLDKNNALAPNIVRWLMVARKVGYWETTQETAWALIGLTDWMKATGELKPNYDYALFLNDKSISEGHIAPAQVQDPIKLQIAVKDLIADVGNKLRFSRGDGEGVLYYTAHLKVYQPVEDLKPANRGVIVSRRYTLTSCAETDRSKCPEVREAKLGDVIRVDLTIVAPHDLYYLVVEDPLPAGAEAVDTGLATTSMLAQGVSVSREPSYDFEGRGFYSPFYYWWNWYTRAEMRDEKVVLFTDYLYRGTYEYSYTMRATLPGDYKVIPTVASEFYFPEVFGRSDGRLLSIGK
jgi:hypothetical protein